MTRTPLNGSVAVGTFMKLYAGEWYYLANENVTWTKAPSSNVRAFELWSVFVLKREWKAARE